jgi:hypothetical protein
MSGGGHQDFRWLRIAFDNVQQDLNDNSGFPSAYTCDGQVELF